MRAPKFGSGLDGPNGKAPPNLSLAAGKRVDGVCGSDVAGKTQEYGLWLFQVSKDVQLSYGGLVWRFFGQTFKTSSKVKPNWLYATEQG